MQTKVAEAITQVLADHNIRYVIGAPGTSELAFVDAVSQHPNMEYLFVLHENACVGIADGYARVTRQVSVVNLHAAQGTLNAMGFLRAAQKDGTPLLALIGAPSTTYAIHEPNHFLHGLVDVVRPVSKWTWMVTAPHEAPLAVARALTIAKADPPGPTVVAIPQDILASTFSFPDQLARPVVIAPTVPSPKNLAETARRLSAAKTPILYLGVGVARSGAFHEAVSLAELIGAKVISEALDRGPMLHGVNFPSNHPLFLGFFSSRDPRIKSALDECDLLFEIGCRSTYARVIGWQPDKCFCIQLDANAQEMGKNHRTDMGLVGNIKATLGELVTFLKPKSGQESNASKTVKTEAYIQDKIGQNSSDRDPITPTMLAKTLASSAKQSDILVDDSQSMSYYMKQYYPFTEPDTLFGSNSSHLGWAMPAATGIRLALRTSDRRVICVVGDGSFTFGVQSLATMSRYGLQVIVVIANNQGYMSLQFELQGHGKSISEKTLQTLSLRQAPYDFAQVAKGFGIQGHRVSNIGELKIALASALGSKEACVLDVVMSTDPEEWRLGWYIPKE